MLSHLLYYYVCVSKRNRSIETANNSIKGYGRSLDSCRDYEVTLDRWRGSPLVRRWESLSQLAPRPL